MHPLFSAYNPEAACAHMYAHLDTQTQKTTRNNHEVPHTLTEYIVQNKKQDKHKVKVTIDVPSWYGR